MGRRHRLLCGAIVMSCVSGALHAASQDAIKLDIAHGPYVQAVTESSATVVWFTNRNCIPKVEYGPVDGNQVTTAVSARHGPVSFLVLDCGEDKADTNKEYSGLVAFDAYMAEQTQWLRHAVRSDAFRTARYRVVLVHIPPIASGQAYGVTRIRNLWSPILDEANIDLAFCGHTHRFARIEMNGSTNPYPILVNAPDMVVQVDVSRDQLNVTVRKIDGQTVEAFFVKSRSTE
ncbi:MAG: metallophosphoesterase [Phycisphaerae bacterium]|nr:metallophosphoesterase [Phycisphaerae bacterium]